MKWLICINNAPLSLLGGYFWEFFVLALLWPDIKSLLWKVILSRLGFDREQAINQIEEDIQAMLDYVWLQWSLFLGPNDPLLILNDGIIA